MIMMCGVAAGDGQLPGYRLSHMRRSGRRKAGQEMKDENSKPIPTTATAGGRGTTKSTDARMRAADEGTGDIAPEAER